MRPGFAHTGAGQGTPGYGMPQDDVLSDPPGWHEDRACCCPAQPVVRAIMPPTAERRYPVDLLLCGHHYRVSRQGLTAARARVEYLPGKADAAVAALLETVHQDHVDVM